MSKLSAYDFFEMAEFPRDDRQNLSPATSMLYDLLSVWPDPTARIRSRGYIICNDPYIRCSRLVFSSLKLGRKSHSYSTTITRIEKDRWKVKIRYRWRREREREREERDGGEKERERERKRLRRAMFWSDLSIWPEMIHTRGTTEPALSADSARFPGHRYIRFL